MRNEVETRSVAAELQRAGLNVVVDAPLAPLVTYGVGGPAGCLVRADDARDVVSAAGVLSRYPATNVVVIGRGSNLLVADDGFDGVVLWMAGDAGDAAVSFEGDDVVVDAGTPMPVLARRCSAQGRAGLEWAVGIPGSVGGAVRMNAGGHGSDMDACLVEASVVSLRSGSVRTVGHDDLGFHFRGSALAAHHVVLNARLRTTKGEPDRCLEQLAGIVSWRRENQPGGRNAGSVFVNPGEGPMSAGAIIDSCDLRGLRVGGAEVSTRHANFIQAGTGATAQDVVDLMTVVQKRVEEATGIRLGSEVRLVGFGPSVETRFVDTRHATPQRVAEARSLAALMGDEEVVGP